MENTLLGPPVKAAFQEAADPAVHAQVPATAPNQDATYGWPAQWRLAPKLVGAPNTILLAEDDDDLRQITTAILEMTGYKVFPCANAELALEAFSGRTNIDLLLTDLEMPGRSGADLARTVTTLRPSLPVLIVSGSLITTALRREMEDKQWQFLSKPYSLDIFLDTIRVLLSPSFQTHGIDSWIVQRNRRFAGL